MDTTALLLLATRSVQPPDWSLTDTSTNANANNGTQLLTKAWTIPAYDALAGTVYEIEVPFSGTVENTHTLGFVPNFNGSSVATSGGDTLSATFFGAATAFTGIVTLIVQILTTGTGGTCNFFIDGGLGQNAPQVSGTATFLTSQATGHAIDTTSSNTIAVNSVWGGSTAGQTVTGRGSTFTRRGR